MKLKARGHRLLIKPDPVEKISAGGIVLSINEKQERQASQKGTVLGVGPMAWKNEAYGYGLEGWEPWVKEGDRILFPRYGGKLVCINDTPTTPDEKREYVIIINDDDVQAQIEED